MEAEVAPKSTTLVFMVISLLEAVYFLLLATLPALMIMHTYRASGSLPRFSAMLPWVLTLALAAVVALILALLFARKVTKSREIRPEPQPRIWSTLEGTALLVVAFKLLFCGALPLSAWAMESAGYISYDAASALLDLAIMSKGLGPAFVLVLSGLLFVVCFGMTRPRTVFLDEEHEVWGAPDTDSPCKC